MRSKSAKDGISLISEMKEFASFSKAAQRYVRRSLDIGFDRCDAVDTWARDEVEVAAIHVQQNLYADLARLRLAIPDDHDLDSIDPFMGRLVRIAAFDLGQGRIDGFNSFRFLYERLLGAAVRPWLPAIFCAAASLPHLHPDRRRHLLQSISQTAATAPGWSNREPSFWPEWVEKSDQPAAA